MQGVTIGEYLKIGKSGLKFMDNYMRSYKPQDVSIASVFIGVLSLIVIGFLATKIIDASYSQRNE